MKWDYPCGIWLGHMMDFSRRKRSSKFEYFGTIAVALASEQPFLQFIHGHVKLHNKLICGILKVNRTVRTREMWTNIKVYKIIHFSRIVIISIFYQTTIKHAHAFL